MAEQKGTPLLQVRDLAITPAGGGAPLVHGVDLDLAAGEGLALVGPSGCGKSLTARAVLGLLPADLVPSGEITWAGQCLTDPHGETWRHARGRGMGLILQEPLAALNPVLTVGAQVAEAVAIHAAVGADEAQRRAHDLLEEVRLPEPGRTAGLYPHQLSGGMRQRVLLAAALACAPRLLIADEPTTALDVALQRDILALVHRLGQERDMAVLFITHDRDLVPLLADRMVVMDAGRIVEVGAVPAADAAPRPVLAEPSVETPVVVHLRGGRVRYPGQATDTVRQIDLDLPAGAAVGLLGRSGCGKTTLARALAGHLPLAASERTGAGASGGGDPLAVRREVQMLFQDPGGSLDPRQRVGEALAEAAGRGGPEVEQLLAEVGLATGLSDRFPHRLSGGQRQRVALARCLAARPRVLVADEPTSALDAGARDLVLALLVDVMLRRGLALLLVSHDVDVLRRACATIHVMHGGVIIETLTAATDFVPRHPATRDLVSAVPRLLRQDPQGWHQVQPGEGAPIVGVLDACPWAGSCAFQKPRCTKGLPPLEEIGEGRRLRCPEAETDGPAHFIDTY